MYLGRIVEIGDAEDVYRRPTHPYTEALLSAIPVPDPVEQRRRKRIVLEGDIPKPDGAAVRLPLPSAVRVRDGRVPRGGPAGVRGPERHDGLLPPAHRGPAARGPPGHVRDATGLSSTSGSNRWANRRSVLISATPVTAIEQRAESAPAASDANDVAT